MVELTEEGESLGIRIFETSFDDKATENSMKNPLYACINENKLITWCQLLTRCVKSYVKVLTFHFDSKFLLVSVYFYCTVVS